MDGGSESILKTTLLLLLEMTTSLQSLRFTTSLFLLLSQFSFLLRPHVLWRQTTTLSWSWSELLHEAVVVFYQSFLAPDSPTQNGASEDVLVATLRATPSLSVGLIGVEVARGTLAVGTASSGSHYFDFVATIALRRLIHSRITREGELWFLVCAVCGSVEHRLVVLW